MTQDEMKKKYETLNANEAAAKTAKDLNDKFSLIIKGNIHCGDEIGCFINEKTGEKFYYQKGKKKNDF